MGLSFGSIPRLGVGSLLVVPRESTSRYSRLCVLLALFALVAKIKFQPL